MGAPWRHLRALSVMPARDDESSQVGARLLFGFLLGDGGRANRERVLGGRNLRLPSVMSKHLQVAASTIHSWSVAYNQREGAPGGPRSAPSHHALVHQLVHHLRRGVTVRERLRRMLAASLPASYAHQVIDFHSVVY
jgi:hypothetical protein